MGCFAHQVEGVRKSNKVNDGLLHEIPFIYPDQIKALQVVFKEQNPKNTFIYMGNNYLESDDAVMSALKEAIPDQDFISFNDKRGLKNWLHSSNMNQHLVLHLLSQWNSVFSEISGMEFPSMIYLYPTCLKCGYGQKLSSFITRAKASLIIARYETQICNFCENVRDPDESDVLF